MNIEELLQGRNPYGRAGGNLANLMAAASAAGSRQLDPRLGQMGFMFRDNGMDENPTPQYTQYSGQNDWNGLGERTLNGQRYLQIGDFFQDGRNRNADDIARLVRDPSQIQYDEMGGLITPYENFTGLTPDDFMTNLVRTGIGAAAVAGTGAGIGNAFFGTPSITSLLGGGTSGGLLSPPPLEGAPSLLSPSGAAAQQALPGLTQLGINGTSGAMLPGSGLGASSALGGTFDSTGWQGTGINGSTGTRDIGSALSNAMNRYGMQAGNNIGSFFNDPLGAMTRNPLNTIRGINSIYNIGSALAGGNQPQTSQQTDSKGGGGSSMNMPQAQYTPNPFNISQFARLYGR